MKVFYSTPYLTENIAKTEPGVRVSPGWKNFTNLVDKLLGSQFDVVYEPKKVDLEVYCGQPFYYRKPLMHPAVYISMFEKRILPENWVDSYNNFDLILNPSAWGVQSYRDAGVKNVEYLLAPLRTDFSAERNLTDEFIALTQVAIVGDRKGSQLMRDIYMSEDMPGTLVIKAAPFYSGISLRGKISENIELIQAYLEKEDYDYFLSQVNLSVNPTAGEGFGLIPAEHILRCIPTMVTNYSGCVEYADCCIDTFSYIDNVGALDISVNREDIITKIHKAYDNRAELEQQAQYNAQRMRERFKDYQDLKPLFSRLVDSVDTEYNVNSVENIKEEIIERIKNPELR